MKRHIDIPASYVLSLDMFPELLAAAGLTKAELSRRLGITAHQVTVWKNAPPAYAVAYLKLLVELREAKK